jgi:hypothetical protein
MILIEYPVEAYGSEPGPIVFWRGGPRDFHRLLNDLHPFGLEEPREVFLETMDYIAFSGFSSFRLRSTADGNILLRHRDGVLEMCLDAGHWRDILHNVLAVSFGGGFVFQEFDGEDLVEDATIIMHSGFENPTRIAP